MGRPSKSIHAGVDIVTNARFAPRRAPPCTRAHLGLAHVGQQIFFFLFFFFLFSSLFLFLFLFWFFFFCSDFVFLFKF
jgi:hypothetical protein